MRLTIQEKDIPQTQAEEVLYHMLFIGNITSIQAIREYGITRLSARIDDLKKLGFDIKSQDVVFTTIHGKKSSFSLYYLNKEK